MDAAALARLGWQPPAPPAPPRAGEVHLWLVRVPTAGPDLAPLLARLTPAERERAAAKRIPEKRAEYVTGQAALRALLARTLGAEPGDLRYRRGVKGKPYLDAPHDAHDVQFNITHSGGVVGVALSAGREVGLDIEWHNERTSAERVARRAFTAAEQAALAAAPPGDPRRRLFFQLWTCKEALVKCTGLGIHSGMEHFDIALNEAGGAQVASARDRQAGVERLHVIPLPLGNGHAGALVHEPPAARLSLHLLAAFPDPLAVL